MPPPKQRPPTRPLSTRPPTTAPATRQFSVTACDGTGTGEKVILYGESGMGKSTLAMMAPNPVFICVDDGIRKLRHPVTEQPANYVAGIQTFQDILDVLAPANFSMWDAYESVVLDTATRAQELCLEWMYANIKNPDTGKQVMRLEDYNFARGYQHIVDTMNMLKGRLDNLQQRGKHLIILAQEGVTIKINPVGEDYMQLGPGLLHTMGKNPKSVRDPYCEWADHVCRIGPLDCTVEQLQAIQARKTDGGYARGFHFGKACGPTDRVVHLRTDGVAMKVKSRTAPDDYVSFSEPKDNALWVSIFGQEWNLGAA